jgi:hypothetical protein
MNSEVQYKYYTDKIVNLLMSLANNQGSILNSLKNDFRWYPKGWQGNPGFVASSQIACTHIICVIQLDEREAEITSSRQVDKAQHLLKVRGLAYIII